MSKPQRILVVDDNPEDRHMYRRFLSENAHDGLQVLETESGDEGLRICRTEAPDCVLLDYQLPDLDGLEFLAALNADPNQRRVAVVMLTGQGDESVAVQAMKAGAQDYLIKGALTAYDLDRAVSNAVEKVSLMQAIELQRKELQRSNRELEQFAYVASHDLQAPLRRTQSFCELLKDKYQGKLDEEADEFIGYIIESARQMQSLINGLLDYARVGMREHTLEPVDCNEIVRQAAGNLQSAIRESNAKLEFDELPTISANRMQILQLFQNLLGNAVKYREQRVPEVRVSARESESEFVFSVQDNGIGIDEKHRDAIFAIFKRLHGDAQYSGSGIGLATCKKIVERHGGRIWVESQLGEGSTFYFAIPRKA